MLEDVDWDSDRVWIGDLPPQEVTPGGLRARLTTCRRVGVEQWVWEGEISLPEGSEGGRIQLQLTRSAGGDERDVRPSTQLVDATVATSGAFALEQARPLDPITPEGMGELEPDVFQFTPAYLDPGEECQLHVASSEVPIEDPSGGPPIVPIDPDEPLGYPARAGSVDSLGLGAHLGDFDDGRLAFAYLAAHEQALPFDAVVVPDLDRVPVRTVFWWSAADAESCPYVELVGDVVITQTDDCTGPVEESDRWNQSNLYRVVDDVVDLDGFHWVEDPDGRRSLSGQVDGWWVHVRSATADDARLVEVARTLRTVTNDLVEPPTARYDTGEDLDAVIDAVLEAESATERARIRQDGWWAIVVEYARTETTWPVAIYAARRHRLGWRLLLLDEVHTDVNSMTAPFVYCVGGTLPYRNIDESFREVEVEVAVALEPDWTLERALDGGWEAVPTERGVWVLDHGDEPSARLPEMRAVDSSGRVVEGQVAVDAGCAP